MSKVKAYFIVVFISTLLYIFLFSIGTNETILNNWLSILLNIVASCIVVVYYEISTSWKYWKLFFQSKLKYRGKDIRLSCSYLFKIKIEDKFLLVKGNRINQYQPVGGVYKKYPDCNNLFKDLEVKDDKNIPIDDKSEEDLRIRVPAKNLIKFLKWYESKEDRETCQWREFNEELIQTGILPSDIFPHIQYRFLKQIRDGIKYSDYFQTNELMIYDIYELIPNENQKMELKNLLTKTDDRFVLVEEDIILSLGYYKNIKKYNIGEHSKLIL